MIKPILILLLAFFLIFLLFIFFMSPYLKIKYLFILSALGIVIYFIYTGKIGYLFSFLRSILPNLLKLLGI